MELKDYKDNINVRAYVLYVYHRFRASGQLSHIKQYLKRLPEDIKEMENVRGILHHDAIDFLKKAGFNEKEISIFLESEIEEEIKYGGKDLVDGELQCGCCRMLIKDWREHQKSDLHKLLEEDVYFIHTLWRRVEAMQRLEEQNKLNPVGE